MTRPAPSQPRVAVEDNPVLIAAIRRAAEAQVALDTALVARDAAATEAQEVLRSVKPRFAIVRFSDLGDSWSHSTRILGGLGPFSEAQTPHQAGRLAVAYVESLDSPLHVRP